ncbi:flagellar biosynthetic protein FliQ [Dyella sp.]|uniref:EscS/YscS/HrcS family type III secretion system export apparatus protein n=1 Tax=Dyella sp. TaxID=1869338 RepID=UPI002ED052B9
MDQTQIIKWAFQVVLLASAPALGTAILVGLIVGLVQSVIQVQDQAVSYVIKLAAVSATLLATSHWIMGQIMALFDRILDVIPWTVG